MKNLLKVLFAGAVALAALGSPLSTPAQAQTPTSTPVPGWKVTITDTAGNQFPSPAIYDYPTATPYSFVGATPTAGLNGLSVNTNIIDWLPTGVNDVYVVATLTWVGSSYSGPSTINIQEAGHTYADVQPSRFGPPVESYGDSIEYVADILQLPTSITPTVTPDAFGKQCDVQYTIPYTVPSGAHPSITLPTRRLKYGFVINSTLSPSPDFYEYGWGYSVFVTP